MRWLRGPARVAPAPVVAVAALLFLAGTVPMLLDPRAPSAGWVVLWPLVVGAAFTLAGGGAGRGAAARLLLGTGLSWQLAAVAAAVHLDRVGTVLVSAGAVLLAVAISRIPARTRIRPAWGFLDLLLAVAGAVAVLGAAAGSPLMVAGTGTVLAVTVVGVMWLHFEVSRDDERRRVLWLVLGLSTSVVASGFLSTALDLDPVGEPVVITAEILAALPLPFCAAVAIRAPRRWDVRAVISRAVVGSVMVLLVVVAFAGALAALEAVLPSAPPGWTGALVAVIAAFYHPVLVRVRLSTDELLFGGRADAMQALTGLGSGFAEGSTPQEWVGPLRTALAVSAVELRVDGEVIAGSGSGEAGAQTVRTPLRAGRQEIGELVVTMPPQQLRTTDSTRAVLQLVAAPLAQALHATRLTDELRASRGRVVAALEEERRRVRADLHDGLGPTLTGIAYSADAAANLVRTDPDEAGALLVRLRADATEAIAEIRRIVRGLRPRALDELGLVGAVRQQVDRLRAADGRPMQVRVEAPEQLPELPAAVEVVVYRVAVEAVTNIARHAGVCEAEVSLALRPEGLTLRIQDSGAGEAVWTPGVGLATMRERVEAVGGVLEIAGGRPGGRIVARLPLGS